MTASAPASGPPNCTLGYAPVATRLPAGTSILALPDTETVGAAPVIESDPTVAASASAKDAATPATLIDPAGGEIDTPDEAALKNPMMPHHAASAPFQPAVTAAAVVWIT